MRRLPIIIALLLLTACKRDVCNTPIGEVGRILLADYAEINNVVGGTVVLNRGHRGVKRGGVPEPQSSQRAQVVGNGMGAVPENHAVILHKRAFPEIGQRYVFLAVYQKS